MIQKRNEVTPCLPGKGHLKVHTTYGEAMSCMSIP